MSVSTKLAITNKTGQILTINTLPNYNKFDTTGWVAMLCDADKTNDASDPGVSGDYLYKEFCTINRIAKTLTFAGGVDLTDWGVGDNLVLYNAFLNYTFVGDQTAGPLINITGAPAWRGQATGGGGMFRHSDGRFIWMFTGTTTAVPHIGAIGYAYSSDMIAWTIGNADAPVRVLTDFPDCSSVSTVGSVNPDGSGGYYCLITCISAATGKNVTRILYFDEDFTTFTYSASLLSSVPYYGCVGGSIIKIGAYYHMAYSYQNQVDRDREQRVAKSLNLEGPYVDYQTIVVGTGSNDGVPWSHAADSISIFKDGSKIFGLFGGISRYSLSGTRANRQYCLINFNEETGVWTIDRKSPVIINPTYYQDLDGTYVWAGDHCGGYTSLFVDGTDVYLSMTMHGTIYQVALLKLNYS